MRQRVVAIATLLLLGSIGVLTPSGASAHAPQAGTSTATAYSSNMPHNSTLYVQLMNSLRGYSFMVTDYDNARQSLNIATDSGVVANPPFTDVLPGNTPTPRVLIVMVGSAEETYINNVVGFPACSSATAWGQVQAINPSGSSPHVHSSDQKICIWPTRIGGCSTCRLDTNSEVPISYRYQYLTLKHELGHILNLAHPTDTHNALMRDGTGMLEVNTTESDAIKAHY